MASITAVELGADICALARTTVRGGEVQLLAAETLDPAAYPSIDAFTTALKQVRKSVKLPRRCRAVVWGLPDGSNRKDPAIKPLLAPLIGAGFRVDRAVSPCNALAGLARLRMPRTDGATCWLAINRTGVAIVVVSPGKQLYSHSFAWDSTVGSLGSQARLLQRYSLVAFLAPEIRRAMTACHENGTRIDAIVTCGNLPEIRSLTMPLIEELDVEVETLDSLEGLTVKPDAVDRLADVAASLRLACAGAIARQTRRRDESKRREFGSRATLKIALAAAAIVAALLGGWWWWLQQPARPAAKPSPQSSSRPPGKPSSQNPPAAPKSAPTPAAPVVSAAKPSTANGAQPAAAAQKTPEPQSAANAAQPSAPVQKAPEPRSVTSAAPPPASAQKIPETRSAPEVAAVKPPQPVVQAVPAPGPRPPATTTPAQTPGTNGTPSAPTLTPSKRADGPLAHDATAHPQGTAASTSTKATASPTSTPSGPPPPKIVAPLQTSDEPADTHSTVQGRPLASRPAPAAPMPELLKDPLPRITSILVSSDRRMATIDDGRIIGIGDVVGKRVVVGIDERAVVLREPSGVQIHVALGGRIVGVERSER
jgi:hypothetical protein